ncbi:MAG TPA: glycosyltransferase family 4 protein, partial [Patescibacteria group bacterium]|nr:glycosyltransferase family 4 protein [Patescibacteria group bacterium]
MRILFASDTYPPQVNGAAYFTYRLASALRQRGHQIFVLAPSASGYSCKTNVNGIRVFGISSLPIPFVAPYRFVIP